MSSLSLPSLSGVQAILVLCALILSIHSLRRWLKQYLERRKRIQSHGCQRPPHFPNSNLLLGLDVVFELLYRMKVHTALEGVFSHFLHHGNTFEFLRMGKNSVLTNEPENIKAMLSLKFHDFEHPKKRNDVLASLMGYGIFSSNGSRWKHSRTAIRPMFRRSQLENLDFFERHVCHLIEAIPTVGFFDAQSLFLRLTMDTATEFLFGESCHSLLTTSDDQLQSAFPVAFDYSKEQIARAFHLGFFSRVFLLFRASGAYKICHDYVERDIKKAVKRQMASCQSKKGAGKTPDGFRDRSSVVDELVRSTQDVKILRAQVMPLLFAGRDGTASLLSSLFHTLARRPDIWDKLQLEVGKMRNRRPTLEDLNNMKYLRYVINECLRLYPPVPSNVRVANKDTILPLGGGADGQSPLFVRKGTTVAYVIWCTHRRKDIYGEDAEDFKPERWEKLRVSWEFLPFNGGPRICLGQQFALTEALYTVVRMLQVFKSIESRDQEPWRESLDVTCKVDGGVHISLGT